MTINPDTPASLVAEGVKLLDERVPGWWRVINLEELHMADCTVCVLGQLFGHDTETALGAKMFGLPIKPEINTQLKEYGKALAAPSATMTDAQVKIINGARLTLGNEPGYTRAGKVLFTDRHAIGCGSNAALKCEWAKVIAERRAEVEEA